jgi:hypothetical protein
MHGKTNYRVTFGLVACFGVPEYPLPSVRVRAWVYSSLKSLPVLECLLQLQMSLQIRDSRVQSNVYNVDVSIGTRTGSVCVRVGTERWFPIDR